MEAVAEAEYDFAQRLQALVPEALGKVAQIMRDGDDDRVELAAAKDILDRAGYGAVQRSLNVTVNISGVDVDQEIESMLARRAELRAGVTDDDPIDV